MQEKMISTVQAASMPARLTLGTSTFFVSSTKPWRTFREEESVYEIDPCLKKSVPLLSNNRNWLVASQERCLYSRHRKKVAGQRMTAELNQILAAPTNSRAKAIPN
jgi:hypothetical protein